MSELCNCVVQCLAIALMELMMKLTHQSSKNSGLSGNQKGRALILVRRLCTVLMGVSSAYCTVPKAHRYGFNGRRAPRSIVGQSRP